ncbi:hypothetical protein GIB67_041944 [Kingdonia uniflora]|uniref:Uncharacterized protein n=1 Tax=Kingdonia uniflora TaxID=39325 RepID=A0A7J7N1I6_9MAGN|nr:hypothetical protein GIB67_041944 [Kingdonia uniflora]
MRYSNIEEEMIEMLQIAMACIARMLHQRPKMSDVLKMVKNVQQFDNGTIFLQVVLCLHQMRLGCNPLKSHDFFCFRFYLKM